MSPCTSMRVQHRPSILMSAAGFVALALQVLYACARRRNGWVTRRRLALAHGNGVTEVQKANIERA